jgi:uncharacterized Zn finger protein
MPITEAQIRSAASAESFSRGEDYYRSGAVIDLQQRGDTLLAQVEGSEYEPYEVTIELANGELVEADCTCPILPLCHSLAGKGSPGLPGRRSN